MSVHTFQLFPEHTLTLIAYTNVTNANTIIANLRQQSLSAAVLKSSHIASLFTLLSAANRALHNAAHNQLKTRALESELLYNLSPSHSISYAFKTFGVADDSTSVVVCAFDASAESLQKLETVITGDRVGDAQSVLDALDTDKSEALTKLYKIKPEDMAHRTMADAINSILSIRKFKSR